MRRRYNCVRECNSHLPFFLFVCGRPFRQKRQWGAKNSQTWLDGKRIITIGAKKAWILDKHMNTYIFACVFVLLTRGRGKGCDFFFWHKNRSNSYLNCLFFSRKWSKMRCGLWKTTQTLLPASAFFLLMVAQKAFSCEYSHLHPGHTMCVYGPRECPDKQLFSKTHQMPPKKELFNSNIIFKFKEVENCPQRRNRP